MGELLRNRFVQVLAFVAAVLAVAGEGIVVYTNAQKARIELQSATNAADLKAAEARKMQAEADKARADAETARAMAENAKARQKAESDLATQKAAVELETARNAAKLKAAEADRADAQARSAEIGKKEFEKMVRDPGKFADEALAAAKARMGR